MKKLIISCLAAAFAPMLVFSVDVNYEANGGSGRMSRSTALQESYRKLSPNVFSRPSYEFVGWACAATEPPCYADQVAVTYYSFGKHDGAGNVWLYAAWGKAMFGNGSESMIKKLYPGVKFYTGGKDGYGYWFEDSEGAIVSTNYGTWVAAVVKGPGVFTFTADNALSFYSYTGGDAPNMALGSTGKYYASKIDANVKYSVKIALKGDCILGWSGAPGAKLYDVSYAPQVEVSFDAGEGTIYEESRLYFIGKPYGSLPQAQQWDKAFVGWFTEEGKLITEESIVSEDVKQLYARWSEPVSEPDWNPVTKPDTVIAYVRIYDKSSDVYLTNAEGILAAFAPNGECRGKATLTEGPNGKLFPVTVGVENSSETGLRFKYWSASTGVLEIGETFTASAATIGSISEPRTFYVGASGFVLSQGWTWVSVNVEPDDASFASIFKDVSFADNDVVKSSDGSATYYDGKWYSSPVTFKLVAGRAYAVKKSTAGDVTVTVSGTSATSSLAVTAGWNWIGPMTGNSVSRDALKHSGGFTDNDVISSSSSSATYYGGMWYGSLLSLEPGVGYKAKFGKAGTLSDK